MATFDADHIRACALEMKGKAFDFYAELLPLITTVSGWTLNGSDPNLPTPFQLRVQIEAYEALTKETLRLIDWITEIKQAQPNDFLRYPPVPVFFDGGNFFDGGGDPNA